MSAAFSGRSGSMPTGCAILSLALVVIIAVVGYIAYDMLNTTFAVPEELEPYAVPEETQALIRNTSPAGSGPLTEQQVKLYVNSIDSITVGWAPVLRALDSVIVAESDTTKKINIWGSPAFLRQFFLMPLRARRGLVNYLNDHNLSWGEYFRMKRRTLAAAGITPYEVDSVFHDLVGRYVELEDEKATVTSESMNESFNEIERLRNGMSIDSVEIAAVRPYRDVLLGKGLPAMMNVEEVFEGDDLNLKVAPDTTE